MPLILKAGGARIYLRGGNAQAITHLYGLQEWSYVKSRAESANLFTFKIVEPCLIEGTRYIPAIRDEIFIYKGESDYDNDVRWFGGLITHIEDIAAQYHGASPATGYRIEAQSFDIILDKEIRQPQKAGFSWEDLLQYLLSAHFSTQLSQDFSLIHNTIAAPPIRINNGSLRTLLKAMRQLTNHDYFVDAYKRLQVFQASELTAAFTVDDQQANALTVWDSLPLVTQEGRAIFNIVRQPFQSHITLDQWEGETFTAKGDPKGQGAQFPLLRTPSTIDETSYLEDKFDASTFNAELWIESDNTGTYHVDYPNQGYLFPAEGQCQVLGGTGTLGGVALQSQLFYEFVDSAYIVQEFQLTNMTGEGYICLFTDGAGVTTGNFKAGFHVLNGALKTLSGTTLVSNLGTSANYLLWVTMTRDAWQYAIQGGNYASKQIIHEETGITHATEYKVAPIINKSLQASINSFRFRQSDRAVLLEINGERKVVGLESSDTDLPDIDAFLNLDEMPALLKFKAASDISIISSVASNTQFTVLTGHGAKFKIGHRLLVGDNIVEEFNGLSGIVSSVAGDVLTLLSPGISGMAPGKQVLINTTVPAKGDKLLIKYGYVKGDEAVAYDQASVDKYGALPITLDEKEHLNRFDDAQAEAENYLRRYRDGILLLQFSSNSRLLPVEPEPMTSVVVRLTRRPNPIERVLILQRVEITPLGALEYKYKLYLESADPLTPFDDMFREHSLQIGSDGVIRFSLNFTEHIVSEQECVIHPVSSLYITWINPEGRQWGEFKWKV